MPEQEKKENVGTPEETAVPDVLNKAEEAVVEQPQASEMVSDGTEESVPSPISVEFKENDGVKTLNANLNAGTTSAMFSHSFSNEADNANLTYGTNVKGVNINANVAGNVGGNVSAYGVSANYDETVVETDAGSLTTGASIGVDNGNFNTAVTVGIKRNYINPDNVYDTQNQDRLRQEELVQTGERFNLQTKVGYSEENESLYMENSLMYRFNDNNFLNTTYNQSSNGREITASADLEKIRIDYRNTETNEVGMTSKSNTLDVMKKGGKNQYTLNLAANDVQATEEMGGNQHNFSFGGGAMFNRNQWGAFEDGFNGELATSLSLANGRVSGYKVKIDGAYNVYSENEKGNDYLSRIQFDVGKDGDTKSLSASLSGAMRYNGCRTVIEPALGYINENNSAGHAEQLAISLGTYQQLGKDFGATTIWTRAEIGKGWGNTISQSKLGGFATLGFGGQHQVTKKLALNSEFSYDTSQKWSGNIGFRYSF